MTDWYDSGVEQLHQEIVEYTGVERKDVNRVYSFLTEIGLIDYDIEKDIIFDRYGDEDDDEFTDEFEVGD